MSDFDFNEFQKTQPFGEGSLARFRIIPRIVCADGFSMSVQASETHYCRPRSSGMPSYDAVEVGYPSAAEDALLPFAEDADRPTDTVYGGVPVEVVNEIVNRHGGPK